MSFNQTKKAINIEKLFLKFINVVGPIAAILLATVPVALSIYNRQPQQLPISATFTKNNQTIQLEVARSRRELALGLKFRKSISENTGMLFVVDNAEPIRLWMKDTYVPLDMIFMRDGVVKDIVKNATPCKKEPCPAYGGKLPANQIIEISSGKAQKLGIEVGDKLFINYLIKPPK
ncbi:hypothetical protein NIES4071_102390 (plasmid) [Calothrix sp. NIES-4071]|nr:hypothetical protein NIES4071_102390 [Calothrix sp. NIES-4071]BAZ64620.1 hypothetical protein NIES4105_103530 [Calothrix sp. NIES-4105]